MNKRLTLLMAITLPVFTSVSVAGGDAARGQQLYESRCVACHSVTENRVGPASQGVFGRRAGRVLGYEYSGALKSSKIIWSEKTLNAWLTNPERLIPGQKMGYMVTEAGDRADLIGYLRQISPP
ncbi:MAG: c-type cytochrome [Burkholderiales bacterium]